MSSAAIAEPGSDPRPLRHVGSTSGDQKGNRYDELRECTVHEDARHALRRLRPPLRDAISAELGIGPVCRERHGWDAEIGGIEEAHRVTANGIIHAIAADLGNEAVRAGCRTLRELGFRKVADRIEYRGKDAPALGTVTVRPSTRGTGYYVYAPFKPVVVTAWQMIPGRRYDDQSKENFVPTAARADLWSLLRRFYAGCTLQVLDAERNLRDTRTLEAA